MNVNLINYNRSEPTRISDILQQEKDIKELNIYCNKKHEIHAHQKDKKRYYEFKEGACYEMTSTWPVKDEFGNVSICTMIMNVSSDCITEVLKFNGEDFVSSEEILELIKQNDELYIQGFSLRDAVMKSLEKGKAADVVPTANNNLQNESIVAYQDKEPEGKLDHKVDDDNSLHPFPFINSNALIQAEVNLQHTETQPEIASQQTETQTEVNLQHTKTQTEVASQQIETQTEVNLQRTGTQTEIDSQSIATQTEVSLRQIATQTEVASQQMDELILNNQMLSEENVELKQEMSNLKKEAVELKQEKSDLEDKFDHLEHLNKKMDGNQEQLLEQVLDLQKKLSCSEEVTQELINKLKSAEAEKKEANQELAEAEQRIEALEKQTSELKDKLKKKEQGSKAEIDEICKELTQLKENLKRNEEEFKSVHEEKRKLEDKLKGVNTEKKESEDKLKEFEKEIDQAAHIMKEKEQSISNLKYQMLGLENEYKAQLESYEQEIGKLENMHDEFKEYVASTLESMNKELEENRDALSDIIAGKVLDIEGLTKELQDSKKEIEDLRNQVEMLSAETFADKQKGFNNQFYTLTGDISSEPDNVPRKKIELSRSLSFDSESDNESYVPLEGERRSLRSSSIDDGYGSDKENCDDDLSSNITTTSIEKVAESRNVGKALL